MSNVADKLLQVISNVADKLLQVNQVKQDIKTAIETKGGDLTDVPFTEYANKILEISGGGGVEPVDEYYEYAKDYYIRTNNETLFVNAWEHSLEVDIAEIEKTSNMTNQYGELQYPDGATEGVIIPDGTTKIGDFAFFDWTTNSQPLIIPNSVTSIGDYAFYDWKANIHPLVIPNSVTSIGNRVFYFWSSVPYIEMKAIIPPSLASSNAFDAQNNAPIYVPDDSLDDYKTATNWVNLASRIKPISEKQ